MWKSEDGQARTVSLADPTSAMTDEFVKSIRALDKADRHLLAEASDDLYETLDDLLRAMEPREARTPEEDALPDEFLRGSFSSGGAVRAYLDAVEPAWRLDAYLAVEELLDEIARPDRRLRVAIVCSLLAGVPILGWAVWDAFHPTSYVARGWPFSGIVVGLVLVSIGSGELIHRLRHGAQQPGRRVRRD